jgi:hypothetical protein
MSGESEQKTFGECCPDGTLTDLNVCGGRRRMSRRMRMGTYTSLRGRCMCSPAKELIDRIDVRSGD